MASNQFVVFAIVALMVLPTIILAERHVVGDQSGWTVLFDYQSWVMDRVFRVGDELVFKYDPDQHNVIRVNATGFNDCIVPLGNIGRLNSGNDIITLVTPGMKWYICGAPGHCDNFNQKLAINVISNDEFNDGAPPPPPCAAYGVVISAGYQVVMAVMIAAAMIVVY